MGGTNRRSRRRLSRQARRATEGMTLVEIMIVVIIMALIATAVSVAVLPKLFEAKEGIALSNVSAIRGAVIGYLLDSGDGCPTTTQLIELGELDETTDPLDPWGNEYSIECSGSSVVVTSGGTDGQMGTEDDISTARTQGQ